MAPTKKGKKVVNQEELRRLMREKQRQTSEKKRIESPFAKYNSLGHLSCALCNTHVKSELLWAAHVLGKQHKEKVSELKEGKQTPQNQAVKRKVTDGDEDVNVKKAKQTPGQSTAAVPGDFIEKANSVKTSAGVSLLSGVYDDDDDEDEEMPTAEESTTGTPQPAESAGLPADFFDSSIPTVPAVSHSGSIAKAEVQEKSSEKKDNMAEALPEGFFDDPVRDAKVRNVDAPKDHLDKEWEEFQKEIRQVNTKSEAIVAEDDEEGRLDRQIDEIDEQIQCYKRVEMLRDKRDMAKRRSQSRKEVPMETDAIIEEEENEEELLGLLYQDWRAKGALA
ncbi:zinc finger protein 830 [Corythoichthys intestinalis]|uniref:zinc finger protein 830 n=1 Tax=Corythoichthys intestinalis TaxID=161448 RepID=UPI0025A53331|nr:zinc finger protein 830 [Corythoichthys intestinalis]XP_061794837.1 zinc finger protein 830-like [Nerophis lumbriciformis]